MLSRIRAMTWVTIILTVAIVWESLRMVRLSADDGGRTARDGAARFC